MNGVRRPRTFAEVEDCGGSNVRGDPIDILPTDESHRTRGTRVETYPSIVGEAPQHRCALHHGREPLTGVPRAIRAPAHLAQPNDESVQRCPCCRAIQDLFGNPF